MTNSRLRKGKPCMTNLEGPIGRSILRTILEAEPPDRSELERESEKVKAKILEAKENGTF